MKILLNCWFLLIVSITSYAQTGVQNIRGVVRDGASDQPIVLATVVLLKSSEQVSTVTDSAGNFSLQNIPVGRYDVEITHVGYEPFIIKEVLVSSSKEVVIEVRMKESASDLREVVVRPTFDKTRPLNAMALASARMLSVEEAKRFAGGFDDPARLASSFAGVGIGVGNNGIVVRGNAPKFLQWKLEEIEIPNPNHFADVTGFGGGGLTALSSLVLGNSDFFTGAFPAEYGNALSGVFDIKLRNGNNKRNENAVQLGLIGIDVSSEGPFKKDKQSSYLFNYRYSTLSLLSPLMPDDADGTKYQDLSFKLNFPTAKAGTFSLWGIGLIDRSGQTAETDSSKWEYMQDKETQDVKQYMGAFGLAHKIQIGYNGFLKTSLATTVSGLDLHTERMNDKIQLLPQNVIKKTNWNFVFSSFYNKKFSSTHTNRTGVNITGLMYDMKLNKAEPSGTPMQTVTNENGFSSLLSAYSNSSFHLSGKWVLNAGLYAQYFTLNNRYSIEPRLSAKWQFAPMHSLALAYGLHSRIEMLNYYFTQSENRKFINKDLDFTRAQHLVLSYDWNIGNDFHFRAEPYIQLLYSVPVIPDSSYSFINMQDDWFMHSKLENTGKGLNYGVDITFEKFMSRGFYFLITGSLFQSRYKGGDNVWHNTRFSRNYITNFLIGKEWMAGRNKQNVFNANMRIGYQGGDRYSPINTAASQLQQDAIYDERNAYSQQLSPALLAHFTVSYKLNRKNISHEFAIKVLNATGYKEYYGHRYNFKTFTVDQNREPLMVPNLSYKIEF